MYSGIMGGRNDCEWSRITAQLNGRISLQSARIISWHYGSENTRCRSPILPQQYKNNYLDSTTPSARQYTGTRPHGNSIALKPIINSAAAGSPRISGGLISDEGIVLQATALLNAIPTIQLITIPVPIPIPIPIPSPFISACRVLKHQPRRSEHRLRLRLSGPTHSRCRRRWRIPRRILAPDIIGFGIRAE